MKVLSALLYTVALVAELVGVWFVILDTRREMARLKEVQDYRGPAVDANHTYVGYGGVGRGIEAGQAFRANAILDWMKSRSTERLSASWWKWWRGVVLIFAGSVAGYVGNLVSLLS